MKKRLNAYFSWIPRLRSFIDVTYKDIDKSRNPGIKLEYSFSPDDYQDDTYYNEMSQQLYTLTTTGGIHLKLCVFKEFTSKDIVILHPWIGILEPIDTDDLTKLLSLPRFRVSLSMCLGLIVHNKKIKSILPKNINASVADFFVVKSTEKIFDYEEWKKDGVVVNLNNTREQMSVLNKEVFMTDNFICSCPVVNSKTVDRVLTMISRCVPVALPKNDLTLPILGEEYPFYMDDPSPYNLRKLSQSDVILRASKYIENNICKRASFIVGEISDTKVGRIAINMTP
jgi:hypothetical protein